MAADSRRLTLYAASPAGAAIGLAYCVPFVLWVAGDLNLHAGSALDSGAPGAAAAVRTLVLLQVLVAAVAVPWCMRRTAWSAQLCDALNLVVLAWPLLALLWLTGAAPALQMIRAEALVSIAVAAFWGLNRSWQPPLVRASAAALGTAAAQVTALAAVWAYRDTWMGWTGL